MYSTSTDQQRGTESHPGSCWRPGSSRHLWSRCCGPAFQLQEDESCSLGVPPLVIGLAQPFWSSQRCLRGMCDAVLSRDVASVLDSFVKCRDWPDFIHSLEKLNGIFSRSPQSSVPAKQTIAKRLAQGCTAATPSVHCKVLELYGVILKRIGTEQMARDAPLYSLGIFPLFAHAEASVQLLILDLFESYYLPLGQQLGPCLAGLVSTLFAGMTSTSAEAAPRIVSLLGDLAGIVGSAPLCDAMWRSLLLVPDSRLGGLRWCAGSEVMRQWLQEHMLTVLGQQQAVEAISACLSDTSAVVRLAATQMMVDNFAMDVCCGGDGDRRSCSTPLVRAMILQLRHRDAACAKVCDWIRVACLDKEHVSRHTVPTAVAATVADVAKESADAVARLCSALEVLLAETWAATHVLPSLIPTLLRTYKNAPLEAITQLLSCISAVSVWAALVPKWECVKAVNVGDMSDLETVVSLVDDGKLPLDTACLQAGHVEILLAHISRWLSLMHVKSDSDSGQESELSRMLSLAIRLARMVTSHKDIPWIPLQPIMLRCQEFFVKFVCSRIQTKPVQFGANEFGANEFAARPHAPTTDTTADVSIEFSRACKLLVILHPATLQPRLATAVPAYCQQQETTSPQTDTSGLCLFQRLQKTCTAGETRRLQQAVDAELQMPAWCLAVMHCLSAVHTNVAWAAVNFCVDIATNSVSVCEKISTSLRKAGTLHAELFARRLWNFMSAACCRNETGVESQDAIFLWLRLHQCSPELCASVLRDVLGDSKMYWRCMLEVNLADHRRFGALCARATDSDCIEAGILPMLAFCRVDTALIKSSAAAWLTWMVNNRLPWLFDIILPQLLVASIGNKADVGTAVFLWARLSVVVESPSFAEQASQPIVAPRIQQSKICCEFFDVNSQSKSGDSYSAFTGWLALKVARASADLHITLDPSAQIGCSAVACLHSLVSAASHMSQSGIAAQLTEPTLALLHDSVGHEQISNLQRPLLSVARSLLQQGLTNAVTATPEISTHPFENSTIADASSSTFQTALLRGLSYAHPLESSEAAEWIDFALDSILLLNTTRAATLRGTLTAFSEILGKPLADANNKSSVMARTRLFAHGLRQLVMIHMKGLTDVSAEALPADAIPAALDDTIAADHDGIRASISLANPFSSIRSLMSTAWTEEVPEQAVAAPAVQAGVVIMQALPTVVDCCVSAWTQLRRTDRRPSLPLQSELIDVVSYVWRARPYAMAAGILEWWLNSINKVETEANSGTPARNSLLELLHAMAPASVPAGEFLTVCCRVLGELYNLARSREGGGSSPATAELQWSGLCSRTIADVEPAWVALLSSFVAVCPAESDYSLQLANGWPALRRVCHDALHTALNSLHGPIPPALLLLSLLASFVQKAASSDDCRKERQDLTQRLVGQCLALVTKRPGTALQGPAVLVQESALIGRFLGWEQADQAVTIELLVLKWLASRLQPLCAIVWANDTDVLVSTLGGFVPLVVGQLDSSVEASLSTAAAGLVSTFASEAELLVVWQSPLLSLMQRSKFFHCSVDTLVALRPAVSAIFRKEPSKLSTLLNRTTSTGSSLPNAFKRSPSAARERADGLRRLAFALWCGDFEQHRSALPTVVEALVEALQAAEAAENGTTADHEQAAPILVAVFLCMRVVALRVAEEHLAPFWPLVTAEMLRVLAADSNFREHTKVLWAAQQLLSLLRLLKPVAFVTFEQMFTEPYVTALALACSDGRAANELAQADKYIAVDLVHTE